MRMTYLNTANNMGDITNLIFKKVGWISVQQVMSVKIWSLMRLD